MSEHRNNIQVAIDALYSQRRRKSPGDESETLTRRNDAIFGNHVWQTFAQYFPPGLENRLCRKTIAMVLSADNAIRRSRMTLSE